MVLLGKGIDVTDAFLIFMMALGMPLVFIAGLVYWVSNLKEKKSKIWVSVLGGLAIGMWMCVGCCGGSIFFIRGWAEYQEQLFEDGMNDLGGAREDLLNGSK